MNYPDKWTSRYTFSKRTDTSINIEDDGGFVIARIPRYGRNEPNAYNVTKQEANAALIESVPDMLSALRDAVWLLEGTKSAGRNTSADDMVLNKLNEVINKATNNKV